MSPGEDVFFWILAPLMVLGSLGLIVARKAVHAAICIVFVMVGFAFLYIALDAPFLGIVQIVVYTGAVMMLFLFVLMLVGVDASSSLVETIRGQRWIGVILGLGLGAILGGVVAQTAFPPAVGLDDANSVTNPVGLARVLMSDYVLAMEVVGVVLITAAVSALVLTHKRRLTPARGQKEIAEAKIAALPDGGRLTPLAAPGVYAQNNAMDTPALDPDGRPIAESVSRILRIRGQERSATDVLRGQHGFIDVVTPTSEVESANDDSSSDEEER